MVLGSVPSCCGDCSCALYVSEGSFELCPKGKWKVEISGRNFLKIAYCTNRLFLFLNCLLQFASVGFCLENSCRELQLPGSDFQILSLHRTYVFPSTNKHLFFSIHSNKGLLKPSSLSLIWHFLLEGASKALMQFSPCD